MDYVVEEIGGEFVIPIAGLVCSEAQPGDRLVLRGVDSADEAWVSGSRLGEIVLQELAHREARVERAIATRDSTLRISFDNGASLVNPAEKDVEAWEVRGPGYVLVVAMPGGGEPAIWDGTSEIRTIGPGDSLPSPVVKMFAMYGLEPTGEFQFRRTARGTEAIELHGPDAPPTNRSEVLRLVLPTSGRRAQTDVGGKGNARKGDGT